MLTYKKSTCEMTTPDDAIGEKSSVNDPGFSIN